MSETRSNNLIYHRFGDQARPGDIAGVVLVPGSKGRVRQFAKLWDHARLVADFHEFLVYSGELEGVPLSACSTGIGGSSVAVAIQELLALGAHTFIRVGVTGTLQEDISVGDVTIASAAVRADRISDFFVPPQLPALSSHEVLLSLVAACQGLHYNFHVGVTATSGTFYCGEGRPGAGGYTQSFMGTIVDDFVRSGILDWDTETALLFSLASSYGARAGRINGVLDSPRSGDTDPKAEERAIQAALQAILILADWDRKKAESHQDYLLPETFVSLRGSGDLPDPWQSPTPRPGLPRRGEHPPRNDNPIDFRIGSEGRPGVVERKYFHDSFGGEATPGSVSRYVILVKDPLSVEPLSGILENPQSIADHYEFRVFTGVWQGFPITLCSTGIGGGSASIAVDNLVTLGARTFLYADFALAGAAQSGAWVASGAIRQDGASLDYVRPEFPAAADPEVLMAVLASARDLKIPLAPSLVWASVATLMPQDQPPYQAYNAKLLAAGRGFGVPVVPAGPEIATLLTLCTLYRLRAGAIYATIRAAEEIPAVQNQNFRLALLAMQHLHAWDMEKERRGWKMMTPAVREK